MNLNDGINSDNYYKQIKISLKNEQIKIFTLIYTEGSKIPGGETVRGRSNG